MLKIEEGSKHFCVEQINVLLTEDVGVIALNDPS